MQANTLRREAGLLGLLYASLSGMIGSGWLFGPLTAATMAGPASLLSWLIGGTAILLLALVYAELAALFPVPGAAVVCARLSHGRLLALIVSWAVFLGYTAPGEFIAILAYSNNFLPGLVHPETGAMTPLGFLAAMALLFCFTLLNLLGIRRLLRINTLVTWVKLIVPVATIIALLALSHHGANLQRHGFAPYGLQGALTAVSGAGIVFSFLGFRQSVELAGESARPRRALPIAIAGSVLISLILYLLLQYAFLAALPPAAIAHGWHALSFPGMAGPFAGLALGLGAAWLAVILYIDAVISPAGTALIHFATSTRVAYAMGEARLLPGAVTALNRRGAPWVASLISSAFGALFLFPFPSWQKMISYVSAVIVLSYGIGPLALLSLRKRLPAAVYPRPFHLKGAWVIAPLAFVVCNLIVYWTGYRTVSVLCGLIAIFALGYAVHHRVLRGRSWEDIQWRGAWWVPPYLAGLWLLTRFGERAVGGDNRLPFPYDLGAVAAFSLVILALAVASGIEPEEARAYLEDSKRA